MDYPLFKTELEKKPDQFSLCIARFKIYPNFASERKRQKLNWCFKWDTYKSTATKWRDIKYFQ
jgi:hypothetical protein